MLVTETVAKTKCCPEDRTMETARTKVFQRHITCDGPACMQWKWWDSKNSPDRRGFCGKAGDPTPADLEG